MAGSAGLIRLLSEFDPAQRIPGRGAVMLQHDTGCMHKIKDIP
jgi:hypothetical protein